MGECWSPAESRNRAFHPQTSVKPNYSTVNPTLGLACAPIAGNVLATAHPAIRDGSRPQLDDDSQRFLGQLPQAAGSGVSHLTRADVPTAESRDFQTGIHEAGSPGDKSRS